jgi:hypothetical protein
MLIYTLQKYTLAKLFFLKIYYHISDRDPILSVANFVPTSELRHIEYHSKQTSMNIAQLIRGGIHRHRQHGDLIKLPRFLKKRGGGAGGGAKD